MAQPSPPSPVQTRRPLASVGRADLLRLLVLWGTGKEDTAAQMTGFSYQPPAPQPPAAPPAQQTEAPHKSTAAPTRKIPLRATHYSAIVSTVEGAQVTSNYVQRLAYRQPNAAALPALRSTPPPAWQPLSLQRRLVVFAERHLRHWQPTNQWDAAQLVRQLSLGLPPRKRKARQQRLRWSGNAMVLHMARHTEPLHNDYRVLAQLVQRRAAGQVPIYLHYAGYGWSQYAPQANRHNTSQPQLWRDLPQAPNLRGMAGLAVGWPGGADSWPAQWVPRAHLTAWEPMATPVLSDDQSASPQPTHATHPSQPLPPRASWDTHSRLHTRHQLPRSSQQCPPQQLDQLLALLSLAVVVHPPLLRALRTLLGAPAAAEVQAWSHAHVGCNGIAIAVRADQRSHYIALLGALPMALRQQAAQCIEAHHTQLSSEITLEESQLAHTHALGAAVVPPQAHWQHLATQLRDQPAHASAPEQRAYLARAGHRLDTQTWLQAPELALAWATANPDAVNSPENLPQHFPLQLLPVLREALGSESPKELLGMRLRQQGSSLLVERCSAQQLLSPAPLPHNALAQWSYSSALQWRSSPQQPWQRISDDAARSSIDLAVHAPLEITDGILSCAVQHEPRPAWALEWARDKTSLYALAPSPWGLPVRVQYPDLARETPRSLGQTIYTDKKSVFTLNEDPIGLKANLTLQGKTTQSLRYLPPGQFLMGSPADEHEREDDEGPQHWVTLTEGLWLADTACTQALWLAVMGGKNPSHFTGDNELPVEQVSWDDVQVFLSKLQAYLPAGVQAVLPTEAQWEYACRAGSRAGASTAFSFGQDITPEQVNYDGNHPYRGGAKGAYRKKTVPVKALPANDWGLYQMHGNVWEWCADTMRTYTVDAETNPRGATGKDAGDFAVRGGSWLDRARCARSARRHQWHRGLRRDFLGFRFALRSTAQGAGGPGPEGSPNFGRSPSSPRDGAAPGAVAPDFKKSGSMMDTLRSAFTTNQKKNKNEQ